MNLNSNRFNVRISKFTKIDLWKVVDKMHKQYHHILDWIIINYLVIYFIHNQRENNVISVNHLYDRSYIFFWNIASNIRTLWMSTFVIWSSWKRGIQPKFPKHLSAKSKKNPKYPVDLDKCLCDKTHMYSQVFRVKLSLFNKIFETWVKIYI